MSTRESIALDLLHEPEVLELVRKFTRLHAAAERVFAAGVPIAVVAEHADAMAINRDAFDALTRALYGASAEDEAGGT